MGGRSVRPYQPEGIWEAVGYTASNTAKFSQDHGEALYREQIYIPLVLWFPGHVPAGIRVPDAVSNASIASTVLSVLKLAPVQDFRRPALDALWTSPAQNENASALSEVAQIYPTAAEDLVSEKLVPTSMQGAMKSLTTAQWQLITHERLGNQLYNINSDPRELKDVFHAADTQAVAGKLMLELNSTVTGSPNHKEH